MVEIVTLPDCPYPSEPTQRFTGFGGSLSGPLGGADQALVRVGARYAQDVSYPPMIHDDARRFIVRLVRAEAAVVSMLWPQPGFTPVEAGAMVVDGGPGADFNVGGVLKVRGATAHFPIEEGQFCNIIHGGRRYLHQLVSDTIIAADGTATLGIVPLMRFEPADGDVVQWAKPRIEGFVQGDKREWTVANLKRYGLKFTIQEDR